jgi:predicted XRE-type DNA-binding protein
MVMNVERSSGNVFRDIGFGPKEAESLRLRAQLMVEVQRLINASKLTQNSAAKLFGVTQPRISDLVRGKIELFSIETLVDMLIRAGIRVQLRFAPARQRPTPSGGIIAGLRRTTALNGAELRFADLLQGP